MTKFTGDGRTYKIADDQELLNKCFIKLNLKSETAVASYGYYGFLPENKQRLVVSI